MGKAIKTSEQLYFTKDHALVRCAVIAKIENFT
jgi:hypothetical protein